MIATIQDEIDGQKKWTRKIDRKNTSQLCARSGRNHVVDPLAFLHDCVQHSRVWDTSFPNDTHDALD
jgi:hypothetical protein